MIRRWCCSYRSRIPLRISSVSSTVGSRTITSWKRRCRAASRSMYLRYSSSVVAPMHCNSPRASAGLRMLAASTAPSAAPAPTSVCTSSMKIIQSLLLRISSMIFFRRSSNSPRYFVPATSEPTSSVSKRLPARVSGTSPATSRCANPSTMADLPTPGSPMSAGLSEHLDRLRAHLLEVDSQAFQYTCSDAFTFTYQSQQEVLCADIVMVQATSFINCQLNHLFGTRSKTDLAEHNAVSTANDKFNGAANFVEFNAEVTQYFCGNTLAFAYEPK